MKKLLILITALTLTMPAAANAALKNQTTPQPALAILDTALDTSLPIFKDKIAYEVCILDYASCANGSKTMFGTGAAVMPIGWMKVGGFDHGTQMASAAIQANPNMKIVFIRIVSHNLISGSRKPVSNAIVGEALNWVYANKDLYNIQAVAMSQGTHTLLNATDYCPKEPKTELMITNLLSVGIPTFFAVGNGRDYTKIDWPSCIFNSIAVGATDQIGEIASYSNYDKLLDIYAAGYANMYAPGNIQTYNVGTSVATQIAASQYIAIKSAKPTYTFTQLYDLIIRTSLIAKSGRVPYGKSINLQGALNG